GVTRRAPCWRRAPCPGARSSRPCATRASPRSSTRCSSSRAPSCPTPSPSWRRARWGCRRCSSAPTASSPPSRARGAGAPPAGGRARGRAAWATLAFSLTYVYAYELGAVVRQYTLGLGLALLSFAHLRDALRTGDRRRVRAGAVAAGLAALTSAHSACVAGGGL